MIHPLIVPVLAFFTHALFYSRQRQTCKKVIRRVLYSTIRMKQQLVRCLTSCFHCQSECVIYNLCSQVIVKIPTDYSPRTCQLLILNNWTSNPHRIQTFEEISDYFFNRSGHSRDYLTSTETISESVSIHTPRVCRDSHWSYVPATSFRFQFTRLGWVATVDRLYLGNKSVTSSISRTLQEKQCIYDTIFLFFFFWLIYAAAKHKRYNVIFTFATVDWFVCVFTITAFL